jgi:hypothetical protein
MAMVLPYRLEERISHPLLHECGEDEWCVRLSCWDFPTSLPGEGMHRYFIAIVVRSSPLAIEGYQLFDFFAEDLGKSDDATGPPFAIPGAVTLPSGRVEVIHTVGQLLEQAHETYAQSTWDSIREKMELQPERLDEQWTDQAEKRRWAANGHRSFSMRGDE